MRTLLTCPVCHRPLGLEGRTFRCESGHAFDRAREGYVDLLPVGHGRSGITGDTAEMAGARQRFLGRGHYGRLADRVVSIVAGAVAGAVAGGAAVEEGGAGVAGRGERAVVVEAGCGTGHYVGAIAAALPHAALFGFDVSRDALRLAARAHPGVTFVINDVAHRLCLPDAAADVVLDVFAPRNPAEFRRVLRAGGLLLVVVPTGAHLRELREALPLLSIPSDKRARTIEQLAPAFDLLREEPLEWRTRLDRDDVGDLVGMTPSAFHLDDGAAAALRGLRARTEVTFGFRLLSFSPRGNGRSGAAPADPSPCDGAAGIQPSRRPGPSHR